jgi:uncharacterized protein (TIGR01777 family)
MVDQRGLGRVVIAGGSGFLGTSMAQFLSKQGWSVVILSRRPPRASSTWKHVCWDARTIGDWTRELDGATAMINLVGRSVDCAKTPDHQDEILRSRIESTHVLGVAVRSLNSPPPVWIQMSSAHIYGDPPHVICSEQSPFGYGLAPFVAQVWESEFQASVLPSQRAVVMRTSFVVGRDQGAGNGALARLVPLARIGLGGTVGSGTQGMSWIHETDLNRLFERAMLNPEMSGAYIASSPNPVSSRVFMKELRRAVGIPFGLPAPCWLVRIGAKWILRTDPNLALYGRYVVSKRLEVEKFQFEFPDLRPALTDLFPGLGALPPKQKSSSTSSPKS